MVVYAVIFGSGTYYIVKMLRQGPGGPQPDTEDPTKNPTRKLSFPDDSIDGKEQRA